MDIILLLLLLGSLLVLVYLYVKRVYSYWSDLGVPSVKPLFPFGNLYGVIKSVSLGERTRDLYLTLKHKNCVIGGMYFFVAPNALIIDLDLLRNVFVKDFQNFMDRGMYVNEKGDPLSAHLFSIAGEKWRRMRTKLSPTFTSGKMKMMHETFLRVAEQFKEHLRPMAEQGMEVKLKELLAQFTTDIIGNVAFGLECNSMKEQDNKFRQFGRKIFEISAWDFLKALLMLTFPKLALKANLKFVKPDVSAFFMGTIRKTVEYREKNNVHRNDFLQLLMQLKNTGQVDGDVNTTKEVDKLTFEELAAQLFVFFGAGFETSSSTMTFASYELAMDQQLQEGARKEVRDVLENHQRVMSYEAVLEMHLLDRIIHETLRKYPIVPVLRRECGEAYKVPGTNIVLEKGTIVSIPVMGIHHDPEIYPEPQKFRPERFTKEAIAARHPYAYIPFGKGPRDCIGMRFGMMQTRIGLATILNNFKLSPSEKTPSSMKFNTVGPLLSPAGGLFLRIEEVLMRG